MPKSDPIKSAPKAPKEDEPLKVSIVPDAPATDGETQEPANVENRNKSYLPPTEGVNLNDPPKE
jgi:hypothetical protein